LPWRRVIPGTTPPNGKLLPLCAGLARSATRAAIFSVSDRNLPAASGHEDPIQCHAGNRAQSGARRPHPRQRTAAQCKTIKEKTQPNDWTTAIAKSLLGEALTGLKRSPEAEPLLMAGQKDLAECRDKIPVPERVATLHDSVDRLVRLYEAWNKPAEAAKWKKTLADLLSKEPGKSQSAAQQ